MSLEDAVVMFLVEDSCVFKHADFLAGVRSDLFLSSSLFYEVKVVDLELVFEAIEAGLQLSGLFGK